MIETLRPASREEWLGLRTATVGASEVAALLSCHPYLTAFELYHAKTGMLDFDPTETPPMRRGRMLEKIALEFLREERPSWQIEANPIPGGFFFRDVGQGKSCTPDAFVFDPDRPGKKGLCQVKCVEPSVFRRSWHNDQRQIEPPLYVAIQAIQEAVLTGCDFAYVAPLIVGHGLEVPLIEVPLHRGLVERLDAEIAQFWRRVRDGQPPEPDYARDGDTIARLYDADNGEELDLRAFDHLPDLIDTRDRLKGEINAASEQVVLIDTEFKARLGSYQSATVADGRRVTWREQRRKAYTVEETTFRALKFSKARKEPR